MGPFSGVKMGKAGWDARVAGSSSVIFSPFEDRERLYAIFRSITRCKIALTTSLFLVI